MPIKTRIFWFALTTLISAPLGAIPDRSAPAISFEQAIREFRQAPEFKATASELKSIELDFASRDIVLAPTLQFDAKRINESRELLFSFASNKPKIDNYNFLLTKPFSTGTTLSFGPTWEQALTPTLSPDHRDTVFWQVGITQSLWQDAFGRSTRLRWSQEDFDRRAKLAEALLKHGQNLFDFENLYWDWALAIKTSELQTKNLKRGNELLRWVQDRIRRSAAENTDLLQARALQTRRELAVAELSHSITQTQARLERYLPNLSWQPDPTELNQARLIDSLTMKWIEPLDQADLLRFLQVKNQAEAARVRAETVRESQKPELNLVASYGKNAIDTEASEALSRSFEENHEYSSVGVVFKTGLDFRNERRQLESAQALRDAAELRRRSHAAENKISWSQLQRELKDLSERIQQAQKLVEIQQAKANEERSRYRLGRSTAFQAITFEQEAAEAEITLWNLFALMRKTEAKARLYAR